MTNCRRLAGDGTLHRGGLSLTPRIIGRYLVFEEIAAGGMAAVHLARLRGEAGFSRTIAAKRLHPQYARDPDFVAMFLDEARLASRVRHPNVVTTLDVVSENGEALLVMEYVSGESLSRLFRGVKPNRLPLPVTLAIMTGVLHGLHAAHEATAETGQPLAIVHRDVSPQNIMVGVDGVPRILDFGVAKAAQRSQTTREGQLKGKLSYMPPEQLRRDVVDRRSDVYSAAVVLWEALTGERLFEAQSEAHVVMNVLNKEVPPPSALAPEVPPSIDAIVLRALARDPEQRFQSARDMAIALERCGVAAAPASLVGETVEAVASTTLAGRSRRVAEIERASDQGIPSAADSIRRMSASMPTLVDDQGPSSSAGDYATSASLPQKTAAPAKSNTTLRVALAMVALLAVVGVVVFLKKGIPSAPAPVAGTPAVSTSTSVAAPPEPLPFDPAPAMAAQGIGAAVTAAPTVTAPASTPTPAATTPPTITPATTSAKTPATPAAAPKVAPKATAKADPAASDRCKPPYTVDAAGIRHIKPECM